MRVVLNQDIKGIGKKLQIVDVSEGYARNFLLPKKMAIIADNKAINEAQGKANALKFKKSEEIKSAEEKKQKIEKTCIEFRHKLGEGGKLFGCITEKEIADCLKEKIGINVDKKKIVIKNPIKQIGTFNVDVKLYEGIVAKLKIVVIGA